MNAISKEPERQAIETYACDRCRGVPGRTVRSGSSSCGVVAVAVKPAVAIRQVGSSVPFFFHLSSWA
jgi:hypothetical protein